MKAPGSLLHNVFRCLVGLTFASPILANNEYGSNHNYSGYSGESEIPTVQELPLSNYYGLVRSTLDFKSQPNDWAYHPTIHQIQAPPLPFYTEEQKQVLLDDALRAAWEEYGPKNKQRIANIVTSPSHYAHRDTSSGVPLTGFQASDSEWDQRVTKLSTQPFPPPQPNFFTRFLSSYIDFEVNHHEIADFLRRAVGLVFVGLLVVAWISLGAFLGLFSMKGLFGVGRTRSADDAQVRIGTFENDASGDFAGRVYVALEGDWLRTLQDKIEKETAKKSTETYVQCCILPDKKTNGVADCRVAERGKAKRGFKCSTNLTYNFEFGPKHNQGKIMTKPKHTL
ncbi:unnamed protein product [Allacma fusca]|uniref:Uncharacterized protein n=1 Tax=Allacma fusca TaxID=39272 RepID=A0A8J2NNZ8_9HEXA|nr:unnamed protein product [Allacma fusca]